MPYTQVQTKCSHIPPPPNRAVIIRSSSCFTTVSPRPCCTQLPDLILEQMTSQTTRGGSACSVRQGPRRCNCYPCAQGCHHERHSICRNQPPPVLPATSSPYSYKLHRCWLRVRAPVLAVNIAGTPMAACLVNLVSMLLSELVGR